MPQTQEKIAIEWQAPEFVPHPSRRGLGVFFVLVAAIFLVISVFKGNFSGAILSILAGFLLYIYTQKEPRLTKFAITPKGITAGGDFYDFDALESFWIFYDPPDLKEISIKTHALLSPKLHLPLGDQDPNEIRAVLLKYLPEEKQAPSILDSLARGLGF